MVKYTVMRTSVALTFLVLAALYSTAARSDDVIRSAQALNDCVYGQDAATRPFAITAVVSFASQVHNGRTAFLDETGFAAVHDKTFSSANRLDVGDRIFLEGYVKHFNDGNGYAYATNVHFLSHGLPPKPVPATFQDLSRRRLANCLIQTEGTVIDAFRDEIDSRFLFLVLSDGQDAIYVSSITYELDKNKISGLIGATVSVTGLCSDWRNNSSRKALGTDITIRGLEAVTILKPAPADPFDVPVLQTKNLPFKASKNNVPRRMKIRGNVVATWRRNRMIIRTATGEFSNVRLATADLPPCGAAVEVAGLPETDFYRWNLSRGSWRKIDTSPSTHEQPLEVSAQSLLKDESGRPQFAAHQHGNALRIFGRVTGYDSKESTIQRILLDCQGTPVAVDTSSVPSLHEKVERETVLEITGVCVMETEPWSPYTPFPHIENFFLVARTPDDIRLVAHPPWWTVGKLLGVICSLVFVLLAFAVWNRTLKRLADRRGRQLFKEKIASASSELRIEERTRLAIELHDSISQNLTGISMQIDAANRQLEKHPDKTRNHLGIASRTLDSCREELRNCIWDLRNQTLEEKDMDKVLRRTLQEHVEGATLLIRFNVPRSRLSENTTHALIRIIRELVTNAVRHGGATHIRIAGALETDRLLFSVSDDGCGFDPANHPGAAEGHFGLQGIHERIRQLHGTVTISSAPGKGTKITSQIPTHLEEKQHG